MMLSALKFAVVAVVIIACILWYPYLNPQHIGAFMQRNSVAAPLLFILLCSVRPVLFFLPSMGLTIVAGVLFGAVWGTIYVVIGGALSTPVGYFFARWMGRTAVEKLLKNSKALMDIERRAQAHGRNAVLSMRLFNFPWDLVSYWAGMTGINFRDFYIASLIPLVPVSFLYTYFGSRVFAPASAGFIVSLIIMFLMGAAPVIQSRWRRRKQWRRQ